MPSAIFAPQTPNNDTDHSLPFRRNHRGHFLRAEPQGVRPCRRLRPHRDAIQGRAEFIARNHRSGSGQVPDRLRALQGAGVDRCQVPVFDRLRRGLDGRRLQRAIERRPHAIPELTEPRHGAARPILADHRRGLQRRRIRGSGHGLRGRNGQQRERQHGAGHLA